MDYSMHVECMMYSGKELVKWSAEWKRLWLIPQISDPAQTRKMRENHGLFSTQASIGKRRGKIHLVRIKVSSWDLGEVGGGGCCFRVEPWWRGGCISSHPYLPFPSPPTDQRVNRQDRTLTDNVTLGSKWNCSIISGRRCIQTPKTIYEQAPIRDWQVIAYQPIVTGSNHQVNPTPVFQVTVSAAAEQLGGTSTSQNK